MTRHSVILATISVLECVPVVPEALVEELADLRFAYANLIYSAFNLERPFLCFVVNNSCFCHKKLNVIAI